MRIKSHNLEQAIARLKSFHDDLGVLDITAYGEQAIPALRTILFEREPSGLYQTRCRAVEALSALNAHSVLIQFLEAERQITDPIERVGEDAVINAAALALAAAALTQEKARDQGVFALLLRLARRPVLRGIIGALAAFENAEAIPFLINALEEDGSRLTAEAALRKLGRVARSALLVTVDVKVPSNERESESSARRRRSAVRLLAEMDKSPEVWHDLRHLMHDHDAKVSALACEIGLARVAASERTGIVRRLIELLAQDDWALRQQIEGCFAAHFDRTRDVLEHYLNEGARLADDVAAGRQIETILRRVIARVDSALDAHNDFHAQPR